MKFIECVNLFMAYGMYSA